MSEAWKLAAATAVAFAILVAGWQLAASLPGVPDYVLPSPGAVAAAMANGWIGGAFWEHALFTLQGALGGCLIGALAGIALGAVVAEIRTVERAVYPLVVAVQSMPTVAVAPLIVVYLGVGLPSKIATVALLCFFPVFVNTVAGVRTVDRGLLDLYRAVGAGRLRTFRDVRLPGALDHILASLQIAVVLGFVGCVVSEFVASTAGLGFLIKSYANELNAAVMFAAIISLAMLGAACGGAVAWLHRRLVFWRRR